MSGQGKATPVPPAPTDRDDGAHTNDLLDEALDESFPASDPPALTEPVGEHFNGGRGGAAAPAAEPAQDLPATAANQGQKPTRNDS